MSLGIGIKGSEGIVLAAESRVTFPINIGTPTATNIHYDNATKLLSFKEPHNYIGAITYGLATIGQRTAHSFLPEFEAQLPKKRLPVEEFAKKFSDFYMQQWSAQKNIPNPYNGTPMVFEIAGFDENEPYGKICEVLIPHNPQPRTIIDNDSFNITWGGQRDLVDRMIQGIDTSFLEEIKTDLNLTSDQKKKLDALIPKYGMQLPINAMALQDCVDLAILLIRNTIDTQKLIAGLRGCGGAIDVAIITRRDGLQYVQKKKITGEK